MKKGNNNFQDLFLNNSRKNNVEVTIYLTNGFQLHGLVKGFDPFTVVLQSEGKDILIYKHAITTVNPRESVINDYNN